jgi:hypothetical protein
VGWSCVLAASSSAASSSISRNVRLGFGTRTRIRLQLCLEAQAPRAIDLLDEAISECRQRVIALAGPAASLLGCGLTGWALSASQSTGIVHGLLWGATAAGAVCVLNIIPFEFQEHRRGPRLRSDGLVALRAVRIA